MAFKNIDKRWDSLPYKELMSFPDSFLFVFFVKEIKI